MDTLLTECEVAKRLRMKPGTLRRWRHEGRGPEWVRLEGAVRYAPEALARFVASGRRPISAQQCEKNSDCGLHGGTHQNRVADTTEPRR
jgi:hypothetical protein